MVRHFNNNTMNNKEEIWKDVPDYEGYYQVSDMGSVRSLDRWVVYSNGRERFYKGIAMKQTVSKGYNITGLSKGGVIRTYKFSQLVAMAFLNHKPNGHKLVVDHINGNRADDRLENLRIVTNRANSSTCFRSNRDSFTSEYIGVGWNKENSKWMARIKFKGETTYLGYFTDEVGASNAYQLALSKIKDNSFNPNDYKPKWTSRYKGVHFDKSKDKWIVQIRINGKQKKIGLFPTELEAHHAYLKAEKENNLSTH